MRNHNVRRSLLRAALTGSALLPSAFAGGIQLYEIGTPDVGLASAGWAARAQDASTLFKNPAGMSLLSGAQIESGIQLLYGDVAFTPDSDTSPRLGTDGGGNAIGALPGLSLFYVQPLGEKWRIGFGTLSYFGLAANYDPEWVGRYYTQKSTLVGVTLIPSLSYQVNDWLSVGAGLNAMYGYFDTEVAVNNLDPRIGDGQLSLNDRAWGFGADVGILIQASEQTRFGLNYLSAVDLDFKATPKFSNLGPALSQALANPAQLNLGITAPQSMMASVYHQLNDRLGLMADFGWQNWAAFGQVQVGVDSLEPKSLTTDLQYQNTFHGAVGAQYQLNTQWLLTTGVAYDSSAVSDENRTVTVPMGTALRAGVGVQWRVSKSVTLGAAYEFMWAGDMSVDQGSNTDLRGRVAGSYDNSSFSFLTLSLNWHL
jgi:long-chain fatty acid transport protein